MTGPKKGSEDAAQGTPPPSPRESMREVAKSILEAFVVHRAQWPGHRVEEMEIPFTSEGIADATQLALSAVEDALTALSGTGTILVQGATIRVANPDALMDAAGADRDNVSAWLRG
ncbi:MAG: hypothetical protein KGO02_01790 [Alphaproteobacteria bacterium]|nr:hypothetical protein [Alphaproteobacteria bacterium]